MSVEIGDRRIDGFGSVWEVVSVDGQGEYSLREMSTGVVEEFDALEIDELFRPCGGCWGEGLR